MHVATTLFLVVVFGVAARGRTTLVAAQSDQTALRSSPSFATASNDPDAESRARKENIMKAVDQLLEEVSDSALGEYGGGGGAVFAALIRTISAEIAPELPATFYRQLRKAAGALSDAVVLAEDQDGMVAFDYIMDGRFLGVPADAVDDLVVLARDLLGRQVQDELRADPRYLSTEACEDVLFLSFNDARRRDYRLWALLLTGLVRSDAVVDGDFIVEEYYERYLEELYDVDDDLLTNMADGCVILASFRAGNLPLFIELILLEIEDDEGYWTLRRLLKVGGLMASQLPFNELQLYRIWRVHRHHRIPIEFGPFLNQILKSVPDLSLH